MKKQVYTEHEAEKVLRKYLPVAKNIITNNVSQAHNFSKKIGFPCVLKIISTQALHKTDVGGVRIVKNKAELEKSYNDLLNVCKVKKLKLQGILIQEFITGKEMIIGIKKDPTFGHIIMVGLGGIFVEIFKDVTFRSCPIDKNEALKMLHELKSIKILKGVRGEKQVKIDIIQDVLVAVSKLPAKYPEISELDINPFIINDKEGKVVDARMVFS